MNSHSIGSTTAVAAAPQSTARALSADAQKSQAVANDVKHVDDVKATQHEDVTPQRDSRSLQFQVDGDRVITTIIDDNNKTVVIQIPDAEVIRIAKAIDRMQGFLVEQKA